MKIKYDAEGNKLKKPLNLTLKQLLKKDACMVLNNLPVISYEELNRQNLKSNVVKRLFPLTKILFGWDEEKTRKEFSDWYDEQRK